MGAARRTENRVMHILRQAKSLAQDYRALTGKPLGVTGEVAEFEAARLLGLELAGARTPGYDATEVVGGVERKLQIKGRCIPAGSSKSQRLGSIDIDKAFDAVLLVILDDNLDAVEIYEAPRDAVVAALKLPGSKSRNKRGALAVSKFRAIGNLRWSAAGGINPAPIMSPEIVRFVKQALKLSTKGPRAVRCQIGSEVIGIQEALALLTKKPKASLDFRCVECREPVRPHREGGGAAHFEHLRRNAACRLSDPERSPAGS